MNSSALAQFSAMSIGGSVLHRGVFIAALVGIDQEVLRRCQILGVLAGIGFFVWV
ncbi:MAG: hypothetical protein OXE81_13350 [Gammaproteobacteria bacterium]|nr:hypothetical protein [Gammaproteobacteria bacterium]MCY4278796.1 hypothetical protein [Gammaproteobacteria bacterium]